jgi:hypothetical protein
LKQASFLEANGAIVEIGWIANKFFSKCITVTFLIFEVCSVTEFVRRLERWNVIFKAKQIKGQ